MPLSNVTFFVWFQTSVVGNSPFRERLGSNRAVDKPRPRFVAADVRSRMRARACVCVGLQLILNLFQFPSSTKLQSSLTDVYFSNGMVLALLMDTR